MRDASDGSEGDVHFLEEGVHETVQDWCGDENGDGIEILHQVVWNTVAGHLICLRDEVSGELGVCHPVEWVKYEHSASDESTLRFVNDLVIPGHCATTTKLLLVCGLWGIHVSVLDHDSNCFERICDDRSLWRSNNVLFSSNINVTKPTQNVHRQSRNADQNPISRSMYGVASKRAHQR